MKFFIYLSPFIFLLLLAVIVIECILVKVPCECIMGNIARDHAPSAIFPIMHERERYFNWFIVAAFLASQRFEMGSPK